MAHFAQLDENGIVTQVVVVNNEECIVDGVESEVKGISFLHTLFPADTVWKQTSYNASFRGKFAAIGDRFNGTDFVSPVVEPIVATDPATDTITSDAGTQIGTGTDTIGV